MNLDTLTQARHLVYTGVAGHTNTIPGVSAFSGKLPVDRTNLWMFRFSGGDAEPTHDGCFAQLFFSGFFQARFDELVNAESWIALFLDYLNVTNNMDNMLPVHTMRLSDHASIETQTLQIFGDEEDTDHWLVTINTEAVLFTA